MLTKYVSDLANQSGINLSSILLVDGQSYGQPDTYLLQMFSKNRLTTTLIYQSDLDDLKQGTKPNLESKIITALSKLRIRQ